MGFWLFDHGFLGTISSFELVGQLKIWSFWEILVLLVLSYFWSKIVSFLGVFMYEVWWFEEMSFEESGMSSSTSMDELGVVTWSSNKCCKRYSPNFFKNVHLFSTSGVWHWLVSATGNGFWSGLQTKIWSLTMGILGMTKESDFFDWLY